MEKFEKIMELIRQSYVLVRWPESQELMDEPWFQEEAILLTGSEEQTGPSAYFIPIKYMM